MADLIPDSNTRFGILSRLSEIISIANFDELVEVVIHSAPRLVNAAACSIYLRPEFMPPNDGMLYQNDLKSIKREEITSDYVVLAATSRPNTEFLIGRAFYPVNIGLTGWVLAHGTPLRLADQSDPMELQAIAPDLRWSDRYKGSRDYYAPDDKKPLLIVPLMSNPGIMGVLKFPATQDKRPFTQADEDIAMIVAQVIANTLEKTIVIRDQAEHIRQLVNIGSKQKPAEVIQLVTLQLGHMVGSQHCRYFGMANGGSRVRLMVDMGLSVAPEGAPQYYRGQNLIGWIFKTGKPLLIPNVRDYLAGKRLDDNLLASISDGPPLDEEDRQLSAHLEGGLNSTGPSVPFMAVPVKSQDGKPLGVLCASCDRDRLDRRSMPFDREMLKLSESFASIIALSLANERDHRLGELLTELGTQSKVDSLFDLVIRQVPELIIGTGCSIFMLEHGDHPLLRLVQSSREGLVDGEQVVDLTYHLNEGKTGFCGMARATLVVNHYGAGAATRKSCQVERQRIEQQHRYDLVTDLLDESGHQVGLIQLRHGFDTTDSVQRAFYKQAKSLRVHAQQGLPTPKTSLYHRYNSPSSWSFVAVPIKAETGELYGVITIGRPVAQSPFLFNDITLIESIANRLGIVLFNLQLQEQRKRLLISLAHEINTPLQSILADTENLMYELPAESELRTMAKHNLDQVLQLHLLTETIMSVLSEQLPSERAFTTHSLYRPLKEAREMFLGEAAAKGCDILGPKPADREDAFPQMEMSLLDLTIAFKNLVHNAVKYSFQPSHSYRSNRYVRITGRWADESHQFYCVSVENFGVGIPQEEIDSGSIFQPFVRGTTASDRRRTGAGLGLAHVRQIIVDMHHGQIEVTSRNMGGDAYLTTFTVTLPIHRPRPGVLTKEEPNA